MEENEQLGRHLVATEDIKPDHILFKDKPLVLSYKLDTLEYTGNKICVGCYKEIPLVNPKKERRWKGEDDMKSGIKLEALEKILGCSRKQERFSVQSEQSNENDDDDGQKEKDNDENSSAGSPIISKNDQDGGGGDELEEEDDDDESDEYDNSNDENNDDDEDLEKNVCLSCRLPICSPACSSHYFHKQLECRLLREAALHNQKQLQQNHENKTFSAAAGAAMATSLSSSSSPPPASSSLGESSNSSSLANGNQDSVSLATTCNNTSYAAPASGSTNITPSISNGIREILLRNLLYFRCLLLKHVNEGHWNELMSLQSNDEARKSDVASLEKTAHIFTFIKKALTEINHPTMSQPAKPDIHKIIGIIEINALHVNISPNVEVTGLFPTYSLLEHSCIPSVKFYLVPCAPPPLPLSLSTMVTEGIGEEDNMKNSGNSKRGSKSSSFLFELYCRSAVKLKSGDHLSVAYTNAMWNTEKRREFLKKEKQFWCECRRCNSADELGSNFSTILCPLQECKAPSVPVSAVKAAVGATGKGGVAVAGSSSGSSNNSGSGSHEFQWKCTSAKCGKACAGWQVKKVDMKLCEMVGKTKPSIESYKECVARMEELVHPDYYLCCIVTHSLIQMYGHDIGSVHDKKLLEEKIAFCNKLLGVMKKLDPGLAVLNIYASVVFYEMHSAILAMAGAEVDEDYHILRNNPETVNLAKVYLQRCIDCFKYEFLEVPETKLKMLAIKKMEYLNLVMNKR